MVVLVLVPGVGIAKLANQSVNIFNWECVCLDSIWKL